MEVTQQILRSLLDYNPETGEFIWRTRTGSARTVKIFNTQFAGKKAGYLCTDGYQYIGISYDGYRSKHAAHIFAWLYVYGEFPDKDVDHINRNPADNSIKNLRLAEVYQNIHNSALSSRNTSGVKGVHWDAGRKKWAVGITINRKRFRIGRFDSLEEAKEAYVTLSKKHLSEFSFY